MIAQDRERVRRAVRGFYVSLVLVSLLAGLTNLATYHRIPFKWSLLTAGAAAYVAMTLRFSVMRHASLAGTLVRQSLGIQAILLLIDALTGLRGWSVDYAIPCVALFEVAAVLLMMLVNRMNWQSYFYVSDHNYISEFCAVDFLENRVDASSASDGAGSRCVGGSAGGDGDSGRPECEAGIEEAVSCVNGRKIGHSKGNDL